MGGQYAELSTAMSVDYTGYRPDIMGKDGKPAEDGSQGADEPAADPASSEQSRGERQ